MAVAHPSKTPAIDATGSYVLRAPWSVDPASSYRCEAIQGFEAIAEKGGNVLSDYYQPKNGIDGFDATDAYNTDRSRNVNIVTLMSGAGETIYVPSTFIISYPNELSVPYGRIVLGVDVGPLPSDFPLDDLKAELAAVAATYVGNGAIMVTTHVVPLAGFVDVNAAANLATARLNQTKDALNIFASKLQTQEENDKLKSKVGALEETLKGFFS
jgi:hypothetical protein